MKYLLVAAAGAGILYALVVGFITLAVSRKWMHAPGDPERSILGEWWR